MTDINTNMRLLRADERGYYMKGGSSPCGSCGIRDMCPRPKTQTSCAEFSPILTFRPPVVGLDGWFNTFRLSHLWYERLSGRVGQTMTLFDTRKGGQLLGHARLTGVAMGTMDQVLERYAWSNHLCLGKGISREEAPEWLRGVLLKNYKTMFKKGDGSDLFTVMFCVRQRDAGSEINSEKVQGGRAA